MFCYTIARLCEYVGTRDKPDNDTRARKYNTGGNIFLSYQSYQLDFENIG